MDKSVLIVGGAFILILVASYVSFVPNESPVTPEQEEIEQSTDTGAQGRGIPTFKWKYEPYMEDEIPRTSISLVAAYENGSTEEKVVDTIQGECNAYSEPDADVYSGSEMIICYYAGLGHYFKVVESDNAYLVQRKVFEETSPEYNPPTESFQTIGQFPR